MAYPGKQAALTVVINKEHVDKFAKLTGDTNPVHLDDDFAQQTPFGRRIAHGMFIGSLFSTIFGTQLPGPGALYLAQTLQFKAPVFLGDEITATVELVKLRKDKPIATFACRCVNQDGVVVVVGEAVLKLPA